MELKNQNDNTKLASNDDSDLVEMDLYNEAFHNQNDGEEDDESYNNDHDESELLLVNVKQHNEECEEAKKQLSSNHYAQKYDRQVIYIESYRRRGQWLDASHRFGGPIS